MRATLNVSSVIRILILIAFSVLVILFVPGTRFRIDAPLGPLVTFFGIMLAILIVRSLDRIEKLNAAIGVELNKTRRIYHLGKNLAAEHLRPWFTDLHGHVYDYHMFFDKNDFSKYEESNPLYREITYHVYTLPAVESSKDLALYSELLKATADVVAARQNIHELRKNALPTYVWLVIGLTTLATLLSILLITPEILTAKIVEAALLAALLLGVDLLFELDSLRFFPRREIAKRYVDNIARLELKSRG